MLNFDEYVEQIEERRAEEKLSVCNAELLRRLTENTYEDAVQELYAALTFRIGIGDLYGEERNNDFELVIPAEKEQELEMAI